MQYPGVSAGAIAGVLYAAGYKPVEIFDIMREKQILQLYRFFIAQGRIVSDGANEKNIA